MPVRRLNHAVLYVRDAQASANFYERVLDFETAADGPARGGFHASSRFDQ